ncbi:MAG: ATP-binding protein [Candidatus Xenobia bacterium]
MTQQLLIDAYLKRLKLPGVARCFIPLAREAEAANQTYEAYLLAVVEQEVQQRDANVQKARLRQAKLPEVKTFEEFEFSAVPSLNKPRVLTLASGEYLAKRENIILLGEQRRRQESHCNGTGGLRLPTGQKGKVCDGTGVG